MFNLPKGLTDYWAERNRARAAHGREPFQKIGPGESARTEAVWGNPLPAAYKAFAATYGCLDFPDEFSGFDYVYQRDSEPRHVRQGNISFLHGLQSLDKTHHHLITTSNCSEVHNVQNL